MQNPLKKSVDISGVEKDVEAPTARKTHSRQKTLEYSITEGAAANFSMSLGERYIIPFALLLKANALHIGLLNSFAGLISPLSQLLGVKLMESHSRKKIVMTFALLQALTWLPIAAISYLAWQNIIPLTLPYLIILLFSIVMAFGGIAFPAWFSWMGDLVPEKDRGKYFSIRNRATGAVGLAAVLIGAFLLDTLKTKGLALLGFSIIFFLAFLFRFLSFTIFKKHYSPQFKLEKEYYFSFWDFIKRFDNFGKFSIYKFFFYGTLMIAAPFFAVYMLEDLQFSYVTFTLVAMSATVFYLLFSPLVGRFSDRFGNVKLAFIGSVLLGTYPLFWLFLKSPLLLILIPQLIAGIGQAAIILSHSNFTYDAVSSQKRGICAAYSNLLAGIGIFIGSLLGGLIIKFLPITFMKPILFVFLLSAALRLITAFVFLPKIKDERKTEGIPTMYLSVAHPVKTIHSEIGWLRNILK